MRVELSADADADLKAIRAYSLREWGLVRTQAYMSALRDRIRLLRHEHALGRLRSEFEIETRSWRVGRHVVFYDVQLERVLVIRVLHERMDFLHHLGRSSEA